MAAAVEVRDASQALRRRCARSTACPSRSQEGEFFALLGPNGAGKTTLISALGGLVRPDSGRLRVMGHDVARDYRAARRLLGIVPQEIVFDPFFTVRETLELQSGYFGLRAQRRLDRRAARAPGARRQGRRQHALALRRHEAPGDGGAGAGAPPAGHRARRADRRASTWSCARRCGSSSASLNAAGHTIVLTTHYLEEAQHLCSRIAMMKAGRIVALDSTERLLAAFSERVLRVKLEGCELPASLAAGAALDAAGWQRIPVGERGPGRERARAPARGRRARSRTSRSPSPSSRRCS